MKKPIYFLVLILLISCSNTRKAIKVSDSDTRYLIKEIKKINDWYVIYAERKDTLCKIVSYALPKNKIDKSRKKIIVGKRYAFTLIPRSENVPVIGGVKIKYISCLVVNRPFCYRNGLVCYKFDEKTEICIEPNRKVYEVYDTDDLDGIYYIKESEK